jgi:hypothetical protein
MNDWSNVLALHVQFPDLACTYESLRDEVNAPLQDADDSSKWMNVVKRRRAVVEELDLCIQEIRRLPDCDRFLLG